jgi:hypothetical protein
MIASDNILKHLDLAVASSNQLDIQHHDPASFGRNADS